MMKKRIFIAYMVSAKLQDIIQRWRMKYLELPVRWIEKKDLHITIVPPWYEENVHSVITTLQAIPHVSIPIPLTFEEISFGPDKKNPKLLWLKSKPSEPLHDLKSFLEGILEKKPDERLFNPHVTLARVPEKNTVSLKKTSIDQQVSWKEVITSFSLVESCIGPNGSIYEKIFEVPLVE